MISTNNNKGGKPFKANKPATGAPKIYKPKGKKAIGTAAKSAEIQPETAPIKEKKKKEKIVNKNKGFPKRYAKADRNNGTEVNPESAAPLINKEPVKPFLKKKMEKKPFIKKEEVKTDKKPNSKPEEETGNFKKHTKFHFEPEVEAPLTLNKYVAHAGICGRREAADLIKAGKIMVNEQKELNPGYRVHEKDVITMAGKQLFSQKNLIYVLLNKPKDFITSTDDEKGRRTVMDLVATASDTRLYPVGRLDRNTSGVLLLTNDGDLAQRLTHPKFNVQKIYQATLDKDLTKTHFDKILNGIKLEDGEIKADELSYLETKKEIGIEIHSGKNRVVRRIFESLGYKVEKLDRVVFAGLTKKNVPRGKWRYLAPKEVTLLKHFKQ